MQYFAEYIFMPQSCLPIVVCPNPGDNCDNMDAHPPGFRAEQLQMLTTFQRMSENDSAAYFFQNYNWRQMFPELDTKSEIVDKVISGQYRVRLMADSSVVIASGSALVSSNIVYAFNFNQAIIACN